MADCTTRRHGIPYTMQRTPGGDSDNYYKESWTPSLVNASFVAKVDWELAQTFVLDMLGEHKRTAGPVGAGRIDRYNPETHPFYPNLYCVGCESVRNLGRLNAHTIPGMGDGVVQYEQMEFVCTFAAFLYQVKENADVDASPLGELIRYVERRGKQIGQSIKAGPGQFEFASAPNLPINTPPAIQIPYRNLSYEWHYVPDPIGNLITTADSYYGTVNLTTFDGRYAAGTLLYLGMDYDPIPSTPAGNLLWRIKHQFAFFKYGWNRSYRPNGGGDLANAGDDNGLWDSVRNHTTGLPPYKSSEFLNLFKV